MDKPKTPTAGRRDATRQSIETGLKKLARSERTVARVARHIHRAERVLRSLRDVEQFRRQR